MLFQTSSVHSQGEKRYKICHQSSTFLKSTPLYLLGTNMYLYGIKMHPLDIKGLFSESVVYFFLLQVLL